jgi:hypothetical protein
MFLRRRGREKKTRLLKGGEIVEEEEKIAVKNINEFETAMFNLVERESSKERKETLNRMIRACDDMECVYWRYPVALKKIDHVRAKIFTNLAQLDGAELKKVGR